MDLETFYDDYYRKKGEDVDHRRLQKIVQLVNHGAEVLQINCGRGILAEKIIKKADITVTDLSKISLKRVRERGILKAFKVDLDSEPLPFKSSQFDVVVSNSKIEHFFFPEKTLSEGTRVLKEGGKFIIMVPNIGHWKFRLWLLFGRFPYLKDTPTDMLHLRFFTFHSMKKLGAQYGLRVKKVRGSAGVWVKSLYPIFFQVPPLKQIYEFLSDIFPSLFARDLLIVFEKK